MPSNHPFTFTRTCMHARRNMDSRIILKACRRVIKDDATIWPIMRDHSVTENPRLLLKTWTGENRESKTETKRENEKTHFKQLFLHSSI